MKDKFNEIITEGDTVIYKEVICTVTVETILGVTGYYLKDMSGYLMSMFNIQPEDLEKQKNIIPINDDIIEIMMRKFPSFSLLPNIPNRIHWIVT